MKLTISFLTINYKTKMMLLIVSEEQVGFEARHFILKLKEPFMMLIIVGEVQVEFKARLFILKLIGPFIMQGIGIMYNDMQNYMTP